MLVPLYGFLKGDTLGIVVLVHDHQKVSDVADTLQRAATSRVRPVARASVFLRGTKLDPEATVAEAGIQALDRVDVEPEVLS